MSMEEWRPIIGYEGIYEVSNKGRVRSLDRYIKQWNGFKDIDRIHRGCVMTPVCNGLGYLQIGLRLSGKTKKRYVHVLVMESFIGLPEEGLEVNHIDHNKSNNSVTNLEYVTKSENHKKRFEFYGTRRKTVFCICGNIIFRASKQCKDCEVIDRTIDGCIERPSLGTLLREVYNSSYVAVGKKYGVSDNTIRHWIKMWHRIMDGQDL